MNPLMAVGSQAVGSFLWHAIKRTASVLFVIGLLWAIYIMAVKPHINPTPTESQKAENITNYNYTMQPKSYFGCQHFGIARPEKEKK